MYFGVYSRSPCVYPSVSSRKSLFISTEFSKFAFSLKKKIKRTKVWIKIEDVYRNVIRCESFLLKGSSSIVSLSRFESKNSTVFPDDVTSLLFTFLRRVSNAAGVSVVNLWSTFLRGIEPMTRGHVTSRSKLRPAGSTNSWKKTALIYVQFPRKITLQAHQRNRMKIVMLCKIIFMSFAWFFFLRTLLG